jgi:hypothetical protein
MTPSNEGLNERLAKEWIDAFNSHDVARLVSLYDEACTHTSPKLRALHPETGGQIEGKAALSKWWTDAIGRLPGLRYELTAVTASEASVFLEYVRHLPGNEPMLVAEVFDVHDGKISASRVYHGYGPASGLTSSCTD